MVNERQNDQWTELEKSTDTELCVRIKWIVFNGANIPITTFCLYFLQVFRRQVLSDEIKHVADTIGTR